MSDETADELAEERLSFIELAAGILVRGGELAAVVLIVLLVCPPLMILLVVVAIPLVALAAVAAIVAAVLWVPYSLARHLRGRRAHHTSIVAHGLQRLRAT